MTRAAGCSLALTILLACSVEPTGHLAVRSSALDPEIVIDAGVQHQHITGFGASSAWTSSSLSESLADQFFSVDKGIGLSLLRLRITPSGTTGELSTARMAQARGAKVWAAPWSPPGEWKTNGDPENGGALLPEHYQNWADRLADFVEDMDTAGVDLLALSAQNEPDWVAIWETCEWTPEELATFIGDYLGPTLAERDLPTKLLGPESANWDSFPSYADAILEHEAARSHVDVIAVHSYGGTAFDYGKHVEAGKELWETEVSESGAFDDGMGSAMRMAQMIHQHLTVAKVNAWHFWWLQPNGGVSTSNSSLLNNGQMTRRGYALGNYARFVRPGAIRIGATPATSGTVQITAFQNENAGPIAVVAVNGSASPQPHQFRFQGLEVELGSVTPWVTSQSATLEAQAPIEVTDQAFGYSLPAYSVTTLVTSLDKPPTGSGGAGGEGGSGEGAGNAGQGGADESGGSAGSGGSGATAGTSSAGTSSTGGTEECCNVPPELPKTPNVACLCRAPGGTPGTDSRVALLSFVALIGFAARRRARSRRA
jgi:glucuronoarabinoxylan endo-1,4-beta-xylanase